MPERVHLFPQPSKPVSPPQWWRRRELPPGPTAFQSDRITLIANDAMRAPILSGRAGRDAGGRVSLPSNLTFDPVRPKPSPGGDRGKNYAGAALPPS